MPHEFIFVLIPYFIGAILSKKLSKTGAGEGLGKRSKRGRPYMWFGHGRGVKPSAHCYKNAVFKKLIRHNDNHFKFHLHYFQDLLSTKIE